MSLPQVRNQRVLACPFHNEFGGVSQFVQNHSKAWKTCNWRRITKLPHFLKYNTVEHYAPLKQAMMDVKRASGKFVDI
jgi:hypothetical protein